MAEAALAVLDTSVIVEPPEDYTEYADAVCVTAESIGELAFGLHTTDPLVTAVRERVYREVLADYDPVPYDAAVAHEYGAVAAAVRAMGRNPRARSAHLMIAATARHLGAAVLTRNPKDFKGVDHLVKIIAVS